MANVDPPKARRYTLLGVPVAFEVVLRLILLLLTIGTLIWAARPKVDSILRDSKVVGVTVTNEERIPAPSTLVCSSYFETVQVEGVIRGDGASIPDRVVPIPQDMYSVANISTLKLRTQGDWPQIGNCLVFKPAEIYFGISTAGSLVKEDNLDTIAIVLMTSKNFTGVKDVGLSMAIWDGAVDVRDQQPIWNGLPSINTVTFMYSEHVPITGNTQTRYTMQKQNLRIMNEGFANKAVVGRVVISPDTFYVTKYYDRPTYTWADLAGAVGGMASIALAVWIFLFGGGKYKSWGIMQRYVLRTSPDSKNDSEPETPSKGVYDRAVGFFRKQLARLDSSADSDLEHMPRQSMSQDRRRSSARYSIVLNMNPAAAAAMATGSSKGARSSVASQGGNGYDHRYPMESPVQSSFYFSDQGTPGSQSLCPLAPIGEGEDDAEEQVSELIRLIDLRVDEKMWSLERTLARYYLDGFRLRNYSHQYIGDQSYLGKDIETAIDPSNQDTRISPMGSSQGVGPIPASPRTPTSPSYPPRPQLRQQYEVIDEEPASTGITASGRKISPPSNGEITKAASSSSSPESTISPSRFPQRRDIRGTIRRAVERLQDEWPQSRSPGPYVPRTQYQARNGSLDASPASEDKNNNPPAY